MNDGFICMACGFLFGTDKHEQGCKPLHDTGDWRCKAHDPREPMIASAWCDECHKNG